MTRLGARLIGIMALAIALSPSACAPEVFGCIDLDEALVWAPSRGTAIAEVAAPAGTVTITMPAGVRMTVCVH
jgi:hypothetical protein